MSNKLGNEVSMAQQILVVPGRSIGKVELGARRQQLPDGTVLKGDLGTVGAIGFSLVDDAVDDVWVDDLEARPVLFEVDGQTIGSELGLADWERHLGHCERVEAVIGGTFYNCSRGLTLGFNIDGTLSQVRLKPR